MYHPSQDHYQPPRPSGQAPVPAPLSLSTQSYHIQGRRPSNMPSDGVAEASPSQGSENESVDVSYYDVPTPDPRSRKWGGKIWTLEVVQQPSRARMCGFGDKDRRPISPPPCIKLIIIDAKTKVEIDYAKVADLSKLVLHVDLWNVDATREDNCVKHASQTSPNISSVITAAYPQVNAQRNPPTFPYNDPGYGSHYQNGYEPATRAFTHGSVSSAIQMPMPRSSQDVTALREGSVARNLIGSASACAVRLEYPEGKVGIWFVLQDLSVRTEGWFRLKMSLFNLAEFVINEDVNVPTPTNRELYTEAPCLSMAFSQPFRVYSAKKFPGVMETTPLSQAFASQGIKIPIRKPDGNKKRKAGDEEDPEDESPEDGNYDE